MKKLPYLGMVLLLFLACNRGPERYSTSGEEVAMIKKLVDDYEKGDWDAWTQAYSDTTKIFYNTRTEHISAKEALEGHQATLELLSSYEFLDEPIFVEKIIDDDGETWVNFWGYWKGTIEANNQEIETPVHLSAQIKDGKIVEEHGFWNNEPLAMALQKIESLNNLSPEENRSIVNAMYQSFAEGDIPAVLEKLDEKVVWNEAEGNPYADGNPYIGPDAVLQGVFTRLGEEHEHFNLKNISLHDVDDDKVLATLRYDSKRKDNGTIMDVQAAHLWTLKNGKAIAFQQYADTKQLSDAVE